MLQQYKLNKHKFTHKKVNQCDIYGFSCKGEKVNESTLLVLMQLKPI